MNVLKFGGTSVATLDQLTAIATYLQAKIEAGEKLIVVVSAMGSETDKLLALAMAACDNPERRELDRLLATGEMKTISLLAIIMRKQGVKALSLTGEQIGLETEGDHLEAKVKSINEQLIKQQLKTNDCLIIAGFQGINAEGEITTLGRGGSDTTAVAIAAKLGTACSIFTDVEGIYSADPNVIKNAKKLKFISYEEMNELSSLGAKVMHNRCITIASKYGTRIYVAKTLADTKGTYIMNHEMIEQNVVTAITMQAKVLATSLAFDSSSQLGAQVMEQVTEAKINVDMISQVYFEKETNLAFTIMPHQRNELQTILANIEQIKNIDINEFAKISLVGSGMRDSYGVVSRVIASLQQSKINIFQITTSEITISLLVDCKKAKQALEILIAEFELEEK